MPRSELMIKRYVFVLYISRLRLRPCSGDVLHSPVPRDIGLGFRVIVLKSVTVYSNSDHFHGFNIQFPLYTLMVFDEWHQGIPVAFILTSRCAEDDLTPWMRALKERVKLDCPEWKPSAFIVDCAQGEINALTYVLKFFFNCFISW